MGLRAQQLGLNLGLRLINHAILIFIKSFYNDVKINAPCFSDVAISEMGQTPHAHKTSYQTSKVSNHAALLQRETFVWYQTYVDR